ncbi:MAG: sigma-54 dependent transcriptional regulator [Desulfobulbaceae bacterium]|jgi:DNA-binding NtrC family response regulator|nr:sigma-54 dependent transcriptional regulator [Desulfobulbaceae bacterium]HKJ13886.1 sigma-54 dependent transcriptional regulator [Desulfobulbales bacterium]MDH3783039.1 sigma-54 dependent transcriptional regulator [Desulfobulbaceae bacterium]MDH3866107.1 sigma-54 dependent transcriptional regulator [Desulfobulbaceae bacterium]MDH3921788.1 sigma-54 dependent transcriptional regulator [Desulfobulbaceae bacterium]
MKINGRIFLLDDDELIVTMLSRALRNEGFETHVQTSSDDIIKKMEAWHPNVILLDINLGEDRNGLDILAEIKANELDVQVVMLTGDDTAESAIKAMKIGAADYLTKPFNIDEVIMVVKGALEKVKLNDEVRYLRKSRMDYAHHEMVGESQVLKDLIENAKKIATAGVPTILITGESGTGKEVLARYMHYWMHQERGENPEDVPYIAVNCTALPDNLIESELFGHTKGAFTDARMDKKGMFELADGGTILLDEIGDMRADLQSTFLRVLENRKIRRLGGTVDLLVDVNVIATTNRDLKEAVAVKDFREDLFFRLSTFSMHLPPLRSRREDISLLARYFLENFKQKYAKKDLEGFTSEAEKRLIEYNWPGNVRELKNVVERCVVLANSELISLENVPLELGAEGDLPFVERRKNPRLILPEEGISLDDVEKDLIRQAMDRAGNNQTKAAKLLNMSYDTLRYQIKKYNLK